jgi:hypothetical protein
MSECVICGSTDDPGREQTCSEACHQQLVERLVSRFGEFKKVVRLSTGVAYRVPARDIIEGGVTERGLDRYPLWDDPLKMTLANGKSVEVSQTEIRDFITVTLIPNAYWRHSGYLSQEEVMRFLKGESGQDELKKVARYILVYTENLAFSAYLFSKAEGKPDESREFNMPAIKRLRAVYQKVSVNHSNNSKLLNLVSEMERVCLEIGADPL